MAEVKGTKNAGWNLENSYASLPRKFFTPVEQNPVKAPELIILNEEVAKSLGLKSEELKNSDNLEIFAGNGFPEGGMPIAQAYAGHQFGHFTMLGDGRAMLLGEQITPEGKRFDIQLKGSGRTPYSRGGDGRAALGPMLREYIISEAMYALGIPTTRSLAVVITGEPTIRETVLPGAILTRVAASHIRVGTFEYASQWGNKEELRALTDYTIERHYPQVKGDNNPYVSFLKQVVKNQAQLIAKWQMVGFIHGVMNTDNITISGETIDYGPCAFMDIYSPKTVFSSIDREGRYAYGQQPYIGGWDLARFAETLVPLLHEKQEEAVDIAQEAINEYSELYHENWLKGMRRKLGMFNEEPQDKALIKDFLTIMEHHKADFTNTFKSLTMGNFEDLPFSEATEFAHWQKQWKERLERQEESQEASIELMKNNNPSVIPRNHRVEEALEAAQKGDYNVMKRLVKVLSTPYAYTEEQKEYCTLPEAVNRPYRTFCGT